MYIPGQAIYGKISFKDGNRPSYPRYYLIVTVNKDVIGILNVSSVQGKERKLLFSSNYLLQQFKPPFLVRTFVKLDSYTEITIEQVNSMKLKHQGETLNEKDLTYILERYPNYN